MVTLPGKSELLTLTATQFRRRPSVAYREIDAGRPVRITRRGKDDVVMVPYALWLRLSGRIDG